MLKVLWGKQLWAVDNATITCMVKYDNVHIKFDEKQFCVFNVGKMNCQLTMNL